MSTTTAAVVSGPVRPTLLSAAAWLVLGAGAGALLAVLAVEVWPKRPEMGDRFLVPIASAVLLFCLRPRWRATQRRPSAAGLLAVAVGAVAFPTAWYLLVQVGPRTLLLWWLSAALVLAAIGLVVAGHGWRRAA